MTIFFFKQKTAYEMRISDWSSDVCSSDLHAVAHRGNAARDLRGRALLAREDLDLLGIAAIGLMRRQHVVIGGDDADVHRRAAADRRLVLARGGEAVREIAARQDAAIGAGLALTLHQVEIGGAAFGAARDDAVGDAGDGGVEISHGSKPFVLSVSKDRSSLRRPKNKDCPSTSSGRTEFLGAMVAQSCQLAPSRSISAIALDGPQLPAV